MKIEKTQFNNTQGIQIKTSTAKLIAISDFGPRIAFLGRAEGKNILLWEPGRHGRGDWDLRGGHRVWPCRPLADESEENYRPDNDPCEVTFQEQGFTMTGSVDPITRTRRGFTVTCLGDTLFQVDNFIVNAGDMLYSGGVWALTCTLPTEGCRYAIPVGDDSDWDNFSMVFFRRWADHGDGSFADSQVQLADDQLIIEPRGREVKRMIQAHKGIIAMSDPDNDLVFAKKIDYDSACQYPLGTNIAAYIGPENFMVEMETMSREKTLKPGETLHHLETWSIRPGALPLENARQSENLFK